MVKMRFGLRYLEAIVLMLGVMAVSACSESKNTARPPQQPRAFEWRAPGLNIAAVSNISFFKILANPEIVDGKVVRVAGVLTIDGDYGSNLYSSREAYEMQLQDQSVHLQLPSQDVEEIARAWQGQYVSVVGTYRKEVDEALLENGLGELYSIQLISSYSEPRERN